MNDYLRVSGELKPELEYELIVKRQIHREEESQRGGGFDAEPVHD